MKNEKIWQQVKKESHLSLDVIDKARQLGFNPKKLTHGGVRSTESLAKPYYLDFIRHLYEKRFGKTL